MANKISKRLKFNKSNNLGKLPVWDLNDLYISIKDKKITKDLSFIKKSYQKFEKKYKGKVKELNAVGLFNAIIKLEKLSEIFFQNIDEKNTEYSSSLIIFTLELNNIEQKKLQKILKNKKIKKFETWIKNSRLFKPHQLNNQMHVSLDQICTI